MWQRYNGTTKIFEKSTDNGASWLPLPLDAAIITQGTLVAWDGLTIGLAGTKKWTLYGGGSDELIFRQFGTADRANLSTAGLLTLSSSIKERGRTTALGEWIAVTYAGGNFNAATGTWTVQSGDQGTFAYTLVGKTMHVVFEIASSSVSASTAHLRITIPGGFSAGRNARNPIVTQDAGGTAGIGMARVVATDNQIYLYKDAAGNNWSIATDSTTVIGEITFEIA